MVAPNTKSKQSVNNSEASGIASVGDNEKNNTGRRMQDNIISKDPNRKYNLDRRVENSDRRVNRDPSYKGPSRRYNIDRRLNLKDRRTGN